jgi:hypothetical protein
MNLSFPSLIPMSNLWSGWLSSVFATQTRPNWSRFQNTFGMLVSLSRMLEAIRKVTNHPIFEIVSLPTDILCSLHNIVWSMKLYLVCY